MPRIKQTKFKTRPKGSGTITKLSGKRRKPYAARVTVYDPDSPRQKMKLLGTYETWEEANQALTLYKMVNENSLNRNMINDELYDKFKTVGKTIPTFEEIYIVVLENLKEKLSQSRINAYNSTFKHLAPIKDKKINTIGLRDMQAIVDDLKDKKYTSKTLADIKTICVNVFEYAVIHEYIDRNNDFTSYIDVSTKVQKKKGHNVLNKTEVQELIDRTDPLSKLLKLELYTGCRPGELLNMKISDIYIDVNEDGYVVSYMIGGSKTKAGRNRIIPIHEEVKSDVIYVIEYAHSKFKNYTDFTNAIKKYCKEYNWNHNAYDTRHTFATIAKESGMNDSARARIMGHKQGNITDDVYTHESIVYLYNELQKLDVKMEYLSK